MTGEECPGGRAVFHTTLVFGPILSGRRCFSAEMPEQFGPRNCGQSEARQKEPASTETINHAGDERLVNLVRGRGPNTARPAVVFLLAERQGYKRMRGNGLALKLR